MTVRFEQNQRILALDILRGYAMLAMLLSHSSWRLPDLDYRVAFGWDNLIVPDLVPPQSVIGFFLQAATPIFFLLAGFSLPMFIESRRKRGWSEGEITRFLVIRGLVLIALEFGFVNLDLAPGTYGQRISVLTAMGLSLIAVAFLRRLNLGALIVLMLALLLSTQIVYYVLGPQEPPSMVYAVLLAPYPTLPWSIEFPVLPWLPVILLGYLSGYAIVQKMICLETYALKIGILLIGLWLVIVANNDIGNLYTARRIIFTKHPPDLAYLFLYLGVAFWLIWLHTRFQPISTRLVFRAVALLGQSALVFYVLHVKVLDMLSFLFSTLELPPLKVSFLMTLVALPVLYFICWQYLTLRRRYPNGLLQYL
ncbi:MAG: DUF1624 domain-containing protein [Chloroflexi bacterium]|nr:DUF1624 domain-containing protein [Chloroflexota bacterium]